MPGKRTVSEGTADLLTVNEAASRLGISPKTFYRHVANGIVPEGYVSRLGGALRIKREYIDSLSPDQSFTYSLIEVAERLHVKPESVNRAIQQGQLHAISVGGETVMPRSELEHLVTEPSKIQDCTRQALIQKGLISGNFPFDNPAAYKGKAEEIRTVVTYVAGRVAQIRRVESDLGVRVGLDEILAQVGKEVMEGKYAANPKMDGGRK